MSLLGCTKVTLQGRASRKFFKNGADSVLFHTLLFLFVALTLVVIFPTALLTWQGFWLSILCALFTFFYQVFYAQALKEGPVSLTVLICNFSTFFVVLYSTLAFGESGVLSAVTNLIISGSATCVSLSSQANLPKQKELILSLNDGGKLQLPAGMRLRVAALYVDGRKRYAGEYTCGNASELISGEGAVIVGEPALKIIIR
jgi:uncharacterized membrane protein